jgi:hypothetical protein
LKSKIKKEKNMIDEKVLIEKLKEIKQKSWSSNKEAPEYTKGYFWGKYEAVLDLEKIVGEIEIDREHFQSTGRNK